MARVKAPLLSEEAHGALGGIEYRTGHYGNMVGRRSISSRQQTQQQLIVRSRLKHAQAAYQAHSADVKTGFDLWAPDPLTGRNVEVARHLRSQNLLVPLPLLPWEAEQVPEIGPFGAAQNPNPPHNIVFEWGGTSGPTTYVLIYTRATWSTAETLTLSKLRFQALAPHNDFFAEWIPEFTATYYHIHATWISLAAEPIFSAYLRLATP